MEEAAEAASAVRKGKPGCVVFCLRRSEGQGGGDGKGGEATPSSIKAVRGPFTPYPVSLGQFLEERSVTNARPPGQRRQTPQSPRRQRDQ